MNYMPRLADLELLQFFAMLKMREIIGGFDHGQTGTCCHCSVLISRCPAQRRGGGSLME
jgi:hypothetical protein